MVVEHLFHSLEHRCVGKLGKVIYQKVMRELALLGVVSFLAVILGNIGDPSRSKNWIGPFLKDGSSWRFLMLELAHVMVFLMAVIYCVMIGIVYFYVRPRCRAHPLATLPSAAASAPQPPPPDPLLLHTCRAVPARVALPVWALPA